MDWDIEVRARARVGIKDGSQRRRGCAKWLISAQVWLVELDGSNETKDAAARRLLRANGYCRAPRFLDAFCGTGPPVVPRPSYLDCAVSEVFERCRPDLERLEARCPLDRNGRTCL